MTFQCSFNPKWFGPRTCLCNYAPLGWPDNYPFKFKGSYKNVQTIKYKFMRLFREQQKIKFWYLNLYFFSISSCYSFPLNYFSRSQRFKNISAIMFISSRLWLYLKLKLNIWNQICWMGTRDMFYISWLIFSFRSKPLIHQYEIWGGKKKKKT